MSSSNKLMITGAFGGMGRVCASLGAEAGFDLVLVDLSTQALGEVQSSLPAQTNVEAYALDVTDEQAVSELVATLKSDGIAAVIHTVGVTPNMTNWQRIVDIDLISSVKFLEAVRPIMTDGSAAVCISSSSGYMVPPNADLDGLLAEPLRDDLMQALEALPGNPLTNTGLAYAYAKKALREYVLAAAQHWGKENKRLVSISPGLIDTEAGQKENAQSKTFDLMQSAIALGRLGKPEEIANTALFLVSPKAGFITGVDILVDGGMIAGM